MSVLGFVESAIREAATLTIRTQTGAPDRYQTPTWVDSDQVPVLVSVPFPLTVEELATRPGSKATARCFARTFPGTHADRLVYRRDSIGGWELDGDPKRWEWPWGDGGHYYEVFLVEVT